MARRLALTLVAAALALPACSSSSDGEELRFDAQVASDFVVTYYDLVHANYCDVVNLATELRDEINAFVAAPSQAGLDACRAAWVEARPFYQQTEMTRFFDSPIDRAPDGPEGEINAWPLDESHLDYVEGAPNAGIVNDASVAIDESSIRAQNELGGEENVALGWHAIEFLLWGQDSDPNGPGDRPFTDYVTDGSGTAANQDRRGQLLMLLAQLLVDDLTQVKNEWAPGQANFRAEFLALPVEEALSRLLTGVGSLAFGELRGERLVVPFNTKLQEDEHSCFSDLTHLDHLHDVIGIENVWLGRYSSSDGLNDVNGTGLTNLAATVNGTEDWQAQIQAVINATLFTLGSNDLVPFDQAILGDDSTPGRQRLAQALADLSDFNDVLSAFAAAMDVEIITTLQE